LSQHYTLLLAQTGKVVEVAYVIDLSFLYYFYDGQDRGTLTGLSLMPVLDY